MARVAVMTVSDGREIARAETEDFSQERHDEVVAALVALGHEVDSSAELIGSNEVARRVARELNGTTPDLAVINIPIWAFPHFTVLAAKELACPLALFSTVDAKYPGMVGMLAAGGALDQLGRRHSRAWGSVNQPDTLATLDRLARAAGAVQALRGSTFGRIGGRPMGMYTAVSSGDQWLVQFGVDVEEIDQYELVRRADLVDPALKTRARSWLEANVAAVHYDGQRLTPEILERQIATYYAMKDLIVDEGLDFCGIKGQPELTDHYCTMDIAEAFLNDPYDWDGPKAPVVCSTEADMDAALTMHVLNSLTATPVLFADLRFYNSELDIWDLCNSGQHATWFAARSDDPTENLRRVHLYPEDFYFPAGGAAVHHLAAPGEMTFARLNRLDGRYRMQVLRGRFEQFDNDTNENIMRASSYVWPHAFARLDAPVEEILSRYGSNHIHAVPGDYVAELREVCRHLSIDFDEFGAGA